jgi:two-component sensor histidine kinase
VTPAREKAERDEKTNGAGSPVMLSPRKRTGLLLQIAVLLTVALIPVGMVAVVQTQRSIDAVRETYLDALRARTMEVATPEREAILGALGIVRALSDAVAVLDPGAEACTALMERMAATDPRLRFVGFIEPPGISRCNNTGRVEDFTGNPASDGLFEDPRGDVRFNPSGNVTRRPVVILSEPVYDPDGTFRGFISLSFPAHRFEGGDEAPGGVQDLGVILLNARGEILSASSPDIRAHLPAGVALPELLALQPGQFSGPSMAGELRDYAIVAIAPGRAYALGSWPTEGTVSRTSPAIVMTIAFPLAMWLVSMAVALVSIHQLVIWPIRDLGRRMRGFADGRRILDAGRLRNAPDEIAEIGGTFETMARKIIRDEADLENTLFEREVLLKEVHHRVKNNLQLMSSILNMQARKVESPEARRALRDVQERLRSLAAIHRGLYQAPELSQVQFDELLAELVDQLVSLAPERLAGSVPELSLAEVRLLPDQAAPLAMLAAEMITNALKYVGTDAAGRRHIGVTLRREPSPSGDLILVEVTNSAQPNSAVDRADGLGRRLMDVLAQQLSGQIETTVGTDRYTISVRFLRAGFQPEDDADA